MIGKHSEETKQKMRETRLKMKEKFGYINSPETREKMSLAKKGCVPWNKGKEMWNGDKRNNLVIPEIKYGEESNNWKGGITKTSLGRWLIKVQEHPFAHINGYVYRYRLVMEDKIGRYLNPEEVVHHIDGNKENDSADNLMLFSSKSEHLKYHKSLC